MSYLRTEARSEGHAVRGRAAAHGRVTHGRADDGEGWGQAVDGRAEGADGRVKLARAGAHGRRAEQGRVERVTADAPVTRGGVEMWWWELTRRVCGTHKKKCENVGWQNLIRWFTHLSSWQYIQWTSDSRERKGVLTKYCFATSSGFLCVKKKVWNMILLFGELVWKILKKENHKIQNP